MISHKTLSVELPIIGILEFDFMTYNRPNLKENSKEIVNKLNSKRLFGVLEKCNLMNKFDQVEAFKYLNKCREDCNRIIKVKKSFQNSFFIFTIFFLQALYLYFHKFF